MKITKFFLNQASKLNYKTKQIVKNKINQIESNPTHFRRVQGFPLPLHRIRIKDKRIIYLLEKEEITILCITERKYNYKDLKKYLQKLGYL